MVQEKKLKKNLADQTNEELLALYRQTGRLEVKQEIALRYLYIVKSIAVQMRNVYAGFSQVEDIVNEGVIMLMKAIDKYEADKNAKFETYVSKRIRGMIIDIARKQDWIPRTVRKSYRDIKEAAVAFYSENGREPTADELSELLDMDKEKFRDIMGKANLFSVLSLDMVLEETKEQYRSIQIPSDKKEEQPEAHLMDKEFRRILADGIRNLKDNEQTVISLYYIEELNMKEIAGIMHVSEPRISQIHAGAIRKLKEYITEKTKVEKEGYHVSGVL
ncbi:sigma-70 family RNA polymerase sigma factor [Extibacter muris]|uniref:sigma-70 family RNA polymerase sigma factor n=1 Tax=Extibacter muris TaxID=1796622 RepID=UPI001D088016|nr:FliA/WhiG family RNA polymerase sigma factor [Extibacter muris]MCB6201404.1 FliA/WhiG family RNA polymerase sigma factor [Extibacter muris]MCQ4662730.1 FliA/WhiG family RNA polymerase sigma factor [Extibacter muris]MCQ4694155.1 FliA/WhiG family RNA polymerase sigma factor [Extibacter muris]